ncbi:MAG: Rpn family recombination-promoting nuclease/putative transposase [Symbiobacteriaceae bacterium]|nr:Rpn family recombination-promoting nuclease/putative transposase [Symbiobacteriaceae bacterium]
MEKLEYTFMTDTLAKMLFVKHPLLLQKLVSQLLRIPFDNIGYFAVTNPEMPPESLGDKYCRFDIHMIVDDRRVELELQIENQGNYPERTLFHWARDYSSALPAGKDYRELPQVIVISIISFSLFDCEEYHSEFMALEVDRYTPLSDKFVLHFFEVQKLPIQIDPDDRLVLWLSLFRAKTEEELRIIEEMEVPEVSEAIEAYRTISVSPEFKEVERLRTKARHDEAQAMLQATLIERRAIATKALGEGIEPGVIARLTGLTVDEVVSLKKTVIE